MSWNTINVPTVSTIWGRGDAGRHYHQFIWLHLLRLNFLGVTLPGLHKLYYTVYIYLNHADLTDYHMGSCYEKSDVFCEQRVWRQEGKQTVGRSSCNKFGCRL